jgi:hypothetical protein
MQRREFIRRSAEIVLGAGVGGVLSGTVSATSAQAALVVDSSTPTPQFATLKTLVGSCASPNQTYNTNTLSEFYRLQELFGRTFEVRRSYDATLPATFAKSKAADDVGKRTSIWSFKSNPSDIISGVVDNNLHAFFASVPLEHRDRLYVCYYAEPENDAFSPADFATASQHVHDIAVQYENDQGHIKAGIILMQWSFTSASGRNPDNWWPGDGHCDYVGFDVYPSFGKHYQMVGELMRAPIAWCKAKNVPFGVAEMGIDPDEKNYTAEKAANWVRGFAAWSQQEKPLFLSYFHSYVGGNYWLDNQPTVLDAYRAVYDDLQ